MERENLEGKKKITIQLAQEVTFLNKASILKSLDQLPDNTKVVIDASKTLYMHYDVTEIIENFKLNAKSRGIDLEIIELHAHKEPMPPLHIDIKK